MIGPVCPTCGSDRCGNHAACSRRRAQERERKAEAERQDLTWWEIFLTSWLLIGMRASLDMLCGISDARLREWTMKRGMAKMSKSDLRLAIAMMDNDKATVWSIVRSRLTDLVVR